jgi:hypothetical protein
VKGGNGPAPAGGMTAPPTGGAAEAETGAAVAAGGPATGMTGGGLEGAPPVEASCDGGGEDTGGGSSGAPPPPVPSPAERPREKSFGVAGGAAEVGGAVKPLAGPLKPGLSGGIEDVPVGIPDDDIPVDGKLRPPDGLPLMGNDGAAGVEV